MGKSAAAMSGVVVIEQENAGHARHEKEDLNGGKSEELPPSPAGERDHRVDEKQPNEKPADNCLGLIARLPGRGEAVNDGERDSSRGDQGREIHQLKPSQEFALASPDTDVREHGAYDTREEPECGKYGDAFPERYFRERAKRFAVAEGQLHFIGVLVEA
jgi:hypothetical protein